MKKCFIKHITTFGIFIIGAIVFTITSVMSIITQNQHEQFSENGKILFICVMSFCIIAAIIVGNIKICFYDEKIIYRILFFKFQFKWSDITECCIVTHWINRYDWPSFYLKMKTANNKKISLELVFKREETLLKICPDARVKQCLKNVFMKKSGSDTVRPVTLSILTSACLNSKI